MICQLRKRIIKEKNLREVCSDTMSEFILKKFHFIDFIRPRIHEVMPFIEKQRKDNSVATNRKRIFGTSSALVQFQFVQEYFFVFHVLFSYYALSLHTCLLTSLSVHSDI